MSLDSSNQKADYWWLLGVFGNKVRVEITKMLLESDYRSLSEIAATLEKRGWKMTLSGVLKHMRELEKAGLVRHEPGIFSEVPDARKTIYFLEGRGRIEQILGHFERDIMDPLRAGLTFNETAKAAHRVQDSGRALPGKEKERLLSLLGECESEKIYQYLTEDEKKKLKLWRMVASVM